MKKTRNKRWNVEGGKSHVEKIPTKPRNKN
jgi:hypothetical protein